MDLVGFQGLRPLGEGAQARVFRAVHRASGEEVALKVFAPAVDLEALHRELEAVGRLDHPALARLWEVGRTTPQDPAVQQGLLPEGSPFLAMELLRGGSLAERPPADWAGLDALVRALLRGLAHAHAAGVLHRDLKPSNVLRASPAGRWVIADFGVARLDGSGPRARISGTPGWWAPEQRQGLADAEGPGTDLYAVGTLVAQLSGLGLSLAGRAAFPVPPGLAPWVSALRDPDPSRRPSVAADALAAWEALGATHGAGGPISLSLSTETWLDDGPPLGEEAEGEPGALGAAFPPAPPVPLPPRELPALPPNHLGLGCLGRRWPPPPPAAGAEERLAAQLRVGASPTGVQVQGAPGSGRSGLIRWFCRAAVEVGLARALDLRPGAVPLAIQLPVALRQEPPAGCAALLSGRALGPLDYRLGCARLIQALSAERPVVVRAEAPLAEALLASGASLGPALFLVPAALDAPLPPGWSRVVLPELSGAALASLLSRQLPLAPSALAALLAAAGGQAGRAQALLERAARDGLLQPGSAGFTLRGSLPEGRSIPPEAAAWAAGGGELTAQQAAQALGGGGQEVMAGARWLVQGGLARWVGPTLRLPGLAARAALASGASPAVARAWLAAGAGEASLAQRAELLLRAGDEAGVALADAFLEATPLASVEAWAWVDLLATVAPSGVALAGLWRAALLAEAGDLAAARQALAGPLPTEAFVRGRRARVEAALARLEGADEAEELERAVRAFAEAGATESAELAAYRLAECRLEAGDSGWEGALRGLLGANSPRVARLAARKLALVSAAAGDDPAPLAAALERRREEALAEGELSAAIRLANALGTVYRQQGRTAERERVLREALALADGEPGHRGVVAFNLGLALLDGSQVEAARRAFAVASAPGSPAGVRQAGALGQAACCGLLDGDWRGLVGQPLPDLLPLAGLWLAVWPVAPEGLRPMIREALLRLRPRLADREADARLEAVLGSSDRAH